MTQRVFVADDELKVRQALRLLLEQAGFAIIGEANDAESMLAQVCLSPPDIILLDWELHGLKPQHHLPAIREYCSGSKVVVLSVHPEAHLNSMALGADAFISKGNPSDELLTVLCAMTEDGE